MKQMECINERIPKLIICIYLIITREKINIAVQEYWNCVIIDLIIVEV